MGTPTVAAIAAAPAVAAVLTEPGRVETRQLDLPVLGLDDGLLAIEACGMCGSDLGPYRSGHNASGARLPMILGHEIVGRISVCGSSAAARWGLAEGDRVIVQEHAPCGRCEQCRTGRDRLCPQQVRYGSRGLDEAPGLWGGYADTLYLHPRSVLHRAPEGVSAHLLALHVPISNGICWAQRLGGVGVGSTVVIFGPGAHGLGTVLAASLAGAQHVIMVGRPSDTARLHASRALGATAVLTTDDDVADAVQQLTGGRGADAVIDITPTNDGVDPLALAPQLCGYGATIVAVGHKRGRPVDGFVTDAVLRKELTIKGTWGRDDESVRAALRLLAQPEVGARLGAMCTGTYPVSQAATALAAFADPAAAGIVHLSIVPDR